MSDESTEVEETTEPTQPQGPWMYRDEWDDNPDNWGQPIPSWLTII